MSNPSSVVVSGPLSAFVPSRSAVSAHAISSVAAATTLSREVGSNTFSDGVIRALDRRTLMTHLVPERPAQLLVSMHEQLHEELHWSTARGVTSAIAGLLAGAGTRGDDLRAVALSMNTVCREVHERFATTISSGAVGVPAAQVVPISRRACPDSG